MEGLRRLSVRDFIEALCNNPSTIPTFHNTYCVTSVHSFSFLSFPLHLDFPGPGACVPYFSLSFSILDIFFLMAAIFLVAVLWLGLSTFNAILSFFLPCSLDAFPGVLATRFRRIFRRLLSSGHRLCLKGWVVVAALVGSPCWRVIAYLN